MRASVACIIRASFWITLKTQRRVASIGCTILALAARLSSGTPLLGGHRRQRRRRGAEHHVDLLFVGQAAEVAHAEGGIGRVVQHRVADRLAADFARQHVDRLAGRNAQRCRGAGEDSVTPAWTSAQAAGLHRPASASSQPSGWERTMVVSCVVVIAVIDAFCEAC